MTSKQKLTILDVTRREGISSKTGRHYDMRIAECVLWQNTSEGEDAVVGTITLPDALKDVGKGEYLADFILTRSMEGQLVPRIIALQPYGDGARPSAPAKKQKLTILSVVRREGISSKTAARMTCALHSASSGKRRPTATAPLLAPSPLPEIAKENGKGEYFAEMAIAQSMDGALVPRIVALQPYVSSTRPTATPKAAAAAAA